MKKALSILKYVLLAISVCSVLLLPIMGESSVGFMLTWMYILLGLTVAVTIILPIINLVKNPKGALSTFVGLAIVVIVLAICYMVSSATPVPNSGGDPFTDPLQLKLSDTGLYATYVALAAAIIISIFGEIKNSFK